MCLCYEMFISRGYHEDRIPSLPYVAKSSGLHLTTAIETLRFLSKQFILHG